MLARIWTLLARIWTLIVPIIAVVGALTIAWAAIMGILTTWHLSGFLGFTFAWNLLVTGLVLLALAKAVGLLERIERHLRSASAAR